MTHLHLPTLDSLRPHLDIAEINIGRQYSLAPLGIVTDDLETLHAVADEHGRVRLRSGIELFFTVYRGQTAEHRPCVSSLARKQHVEEQLLELCRNVAFEDAIGDHPYVQVCEQTRFLENTLLIDRQGLAQHYGLSTDMLDVTSNFDIACFFATCYWDVATRTYRPVERANVPGILYRIQPLPLIEMAANGKFIHVGWQPFHRPEQQRACALIMQAGENFSKLPGVQLVRFRQSEDVSNRIWKSFDKGRMLFPNDAAANLAEQAQCLMQFTRSQFDRAWAKLDSWRGLAISLTDRSPFEMKLGATVVETPVLSWDGLDIERDKGRLREQLEEVLSRVRFRLTKPIDAP